MQESGSRNRGRIGRKCELGVVETLVRCKKESVVFPDRSAKTGAPVVKPIPLSLNVKVIIVRGIGIQHLILQETVAAECQFLGQ